MINVLFALDLISWPILAFTLSMDGPCTNSKTIAARPIWWSLPEVVIRSKRYVSCLKNFYISYIVSAFGWSKFLITFYASRNFPFGNHQWGRWDCCKVASYSWGPPWSISSKALMSDLGSRRSSQGLSYALLGLALGYSAFLSLCLSLLPGSRTIDAFRKGDFDRDWCSIVP